MKEHIESDRVRDEVLLRMNNIYKDFPPEVSFFFDVHGDGWSLIMTRQRSARAEKRAATQGA